LKNTDGLVISAQAVDSGFDQDKSELAILVLTISLQVLADGDSLYQQPVSYVLQYITLK
jgi:hypothetical protein